MSKNVGGAVLSGDPYQLVAAEDSASHIETKKKFKVFVFLNVGGAVPSGDPIINH